MQSTLTGTDQLSITTSQGIGIVPGQSQQQMIKPQQPNITYQIQRTPATNVGLVSTPSLMNSKLLGQVNPQLVASSQNIVAPQTGITVVAGVPGSGTKSPIINVAVTKPQMIPRTQAQIRPTSTVNIVNNSVAANGASLIQQQQLRMMSIAGGNGPNLSAGIHHGLAPVKQPTVANTTTTQASPMQSVQVLNRKKVQDLLREIDPRETMDDDVEELLLQVADDFIENIVTNASKLAKHRKSNTIEAKDIQLHLDRHWNMWIPGFGNEDLRPHKKLAPAEAHRQRMAIIKKSLKK